ncbi:MAG: SPOR domain-containing protein [Candidatus Thiodiazotropha endolucinida]
MAKRSQATKQSVTIDTAKDTEQKENLIDLEDRTPSAALPNELNNKIGKIDSDLDELRSQLSKTNRSVKTSLSHLSDKGSDLTTKVSETYQQLGSLDDAYKSLSEKSATISKDIKTVSKQINQVSEKSDSDIGLLSDGYQSLLARTEELTKKSKQTTQTLNRSIKDNAKMLQELESALVAEIDSLAKHSKERDQDLADKSDEISNDLTKAQDEIKSNQARLLKLQAVDQALEKRVTEVEGTAGDLTKKSRELSRSTTILNKRSSELSDAIDDLRTRTEEHSEQITDLQERVEKGARALVSLIMLEKRHFRILGGMIALLVLGLLVFMGTEYANWRSEAQTNTALQSDIVTTNTHLAVTDSQLSQLSNQTAEADSVIQSDISDINDRLITIGDQVDTLDGRVTNMRPHQTFGSDNTIHGSAWITKQSATNHTIHIATLSDKQEIYKLAERYHSHLKKDLAYLPVKSKNRQQYAMIYGNFSTAADAKSALNRLPRMIQRHRPSVHSMGQVQSFIAK